MPVRAGLLLMRFSNFPLIIAGADIDAESPLACACAKPEVDLDFEPLIILHILGHRRLSSVATLVPARDTMMPP